MSNTKILRAIGGIDDEFVERASQKKKGKQGAFPIWIKWAAPVAACLVIAVMVAMPLLNNGDDFDLTLSSGVSVRHIDNPPALHISENLVFLTEEELFAEYFHGYEIPIFGGIVKEVNNIVMDFNGQEIYRAITKMDIAYEILPVNSSLIQPLIHRDRIFFGWEKIVSTRKHRRPGRK